MDDARQAELRKELLRRELERRQATPEQQPGVFKRALGKVQDFSEGIGVAGLETYYGAKDLLGLGEESDTETLDAWKRAAGESGWGTAGRVTGELAQLAIPGTAGVKAASKIPQAVRFAQGMKAGTRLGADVAGAAALGGIRTPDETESRTQNALVSGAAAGGGAVLGKTLGILGTGIKGSRAAQRLKDMGVKLTAGQQNEVLKRIEGFMNLLPSTAKGVERSRERSYNSLLRKMQAKADPEGRLFNASMMMERQTPKEINRALYQTFKEGYESAWGQTGQISPTGISRMEQALTGNLHKMTAGQQKATQRLGAEIAEKLGDPRNSLKDVDDLIREYWKNPGKNPAKVRVFNQMLKDVRGSLRNELPEPQRQLLSQLDDKYKKFKVLQNASTAAAAEKRAGVITLEDLQQGNRQVTSQFQRSMGDEPFGNMLDDYAKVRGQPKEPLLGTSRAIIKEIPDVLQTRHLQSVLGGTAPWQGPLRKAIEKHYPEELRKLYSAARLGAAYED